MRFADEHLKVACELQQRNLNLILEDYSSKSKANSWLTTDFILEDFLVICQPVHLVALQWTVATIR